MIFGKLTQIRPLVNPSVFKIFWLFAKSFGIISCKLCLYRLTPNYFIMKPVSIGYTVFLGHAVKVQWTEQMPGCIDFSENIRYAHLGFAHTVRPTRGANTHTHTQDSLNKTHSWDGAWSHVSSTHCCHGVSSTPTKPIICIINYWSWSHHIMQTCSIWTCHWRWSLCRVGVEDWCTVLATSVFTIGPCPPPLWPQRLKNRQPNKDRERIIKIK